MSDAIRPNELPYRLRDGIRALKILAFAFPLSIMIWGYPATIRELDPYLTLFGPLLAAALVYYGWNRTHQDSSDRDLNNWKRSTLLENTSKITSIVDQSLITIVFPLLNENTMSYHSSAMLADSSKIERASQLIKMAGYKEIAEKAKTISDELDQTRTSMTAYYDRCADGRTHLDSKVVKTYEDAVQARINIAYDDSEKLVKMVTELLA